MPFPDEHSARLQPPSKYIRFRRGDDEFGVGIDVIWGVTEDGTVGLQAIRFDADRFTPAEARAWLDEHDEHEVLEFEEATGEVENVLKFTSNLADTAHVRRENVDGVAYLVAPVVAVKEGVMNGEFVSAEEIEHLFQTWNGRPFVLAHPEDADGESTTANDPTVLARIGVGRLFNVTFDGDALRGEVWVAVERARKMGTDALELVRRLEKGQPVEVSTAYFRDREETPGEFGGVEYEAIAHDLKPDHLAALLHDVGACSWDDGCGVPRVNKDDSSGVAIVLRIDENLAQRLVVDDGLSENELHLTLAFLGEIPESGPSQKGALLGWLGDWAARHSVVSGDVNGVGRFDNQQDEQPYFAILDAPDLPGLRQDLVDSLGNETDVSHNEDHGFVPHVTLAYLKPDQANPHDSLRIEGVRFSSVGLWWGDERVYFEFGNEEASMEANILSEARQPAFTGTEEIPWADVDRNFEAFRDGYFKHTGAEVPDELPADVAGAPQAMRDWISAKSLLGDPEAETFEDLLFFPVVNPDTDWLNKEAVEVVMASDADVSEDALESAQSVAGELLASEYGSEETENVNVSRLKRALRTISDALGLTENQDSLEELSRRVRIAWENRDLDDGGRFVGLSIKEVLNGSIIVETEEGLSSVPYVDESGDIQFGQPSRVEVVYQPISEEEQEVNNVEELIQRIMNDGRLNTSEEVLSNVPEELIRSLAELLESFTKPEDQEEDVLPPEVNEPETEQQAADTSLPATEPAAETVPVTDPAVNVQLEALQAQVDALTANATADTRERKARFVNALIANSECTYSKQELEAMDAGALEKLARWVAPTNYAGQGGGPLSVAGDNGPVVMRLAPKRQEANNG